MSAATAGEEEVDRSSAPRWIPRRPSFYPPQTARPTPKWRRGGGPTMQILEGGGAGGPLPAFPLDWSGLAPRLGGADAAPPEAGREETAGPEEEGAAATSLSTPSPSSSSAATPPSSPPTEKLDMLARTIEVMGRLVEENRSSVRFGRTSAATSAALFLAPRGTEGDVAPAPTRATGDGHPSSLPSAPTAASSDEAAAYATAGDGGGLVVTTPAPLPESTPDRAAVWAPERMGRWGGGGGRAGRRTARGRGRRGSYRCGLCGMAKAGHRCDARDPLVSMRHEGVQADLGDKKVSLACEGRVLAVRPERWQNCDPAAISEEIFDECHEGCRKEGKVLFVSDKPWDEDLERVSHTPPESPRRKSGTSTGSKSDARIEGSDGTLERCGSADGSSDGFWAEPRGRRDRKSDSRCSMGSQGQRKEGVEDLGSSVRDYPQLPKAEDHSGNFEADEIMGQMVEI